MSNETVLPPKNGHEKDRQPNGSVQHMAKPLKIDPTLDGLIEASATMGGDTWNGDAEVTPSKVALGHVTNAIAASKTKASAIRAWGRERSPTIRRLLANMIGGSRTSRTNRSWLRQSLRASQDSRRR